MHAETTARYNVYYGEGRDAYDVPGRTAHESIFNLNDGPYRCPSTPAGLLAVHHLDARPGLGDAAATPSSSSSSARCRTTAFEVWPLAIWPANRRSLIVSSRRRGLCDFYIDNTPTDGIPYWDTGAPGLAQLGDYLARPADPYNDFEPVDSSAAAIAAQGLLRLGRYLAAQGQDGGAYVQAGLTVAADAVRRAVSLHGRRPPGLAACTPSTTGPTAGTTSRRGSKVPCGESSMWGDYHARELALYIQRLAQDAPYYTFYLRNLARLTRFYR